MKNHVMVELRGKRTIREIANSMGMPPSTYACIENGIRKGRPKTMHKISKFYGVSIEQMFFYDEQYK